MKTFTEALCLGIVGGIAVYTGVVFGLPIWVMFIAWVSFSLCDNSIKKSSLIFIQQVIGIVAAIAVVYMTGLLENHLGDFTLPLIMCVVNIIILYGSKMKRMNSIPAYFIGMVIWFASQYELCIEKSLLMISALIGGFFFGWLNNIVSKSVSRYMSSYSSNKKPL